MNKEGVKDLNKPLFVRFSQNQASDDDIMTSFLQAVSEMSLTPYPAQEEAILELMSNNHVILATPTGSGKSLVATALHYKGFCEGRRSFYTCPIKALVSEKFFTLCDQFGAENVGMLTGDASINRDANIICCTAEVLSNYAVSVDSGIDVSYVIMDEFHYYSDPERGVAWQLPLLSLNHAKFLLMSATLGDVGVIKDSLKELTNVDVAYVTSMERPVPLDFEYFEIPLHETLSNLISERKYPVYVVNFTQRECAIEAQNAMSVNICSKEEKKEIDHALKGFRFDTPFGKDIKRFIRHGVGIHHAGLLPKYRLLVEKLAQSGLLKIIMGTDTLGVGVNVPIRTVVFTKLCKFDGVKTRILTKREFKQIAGRAGRKGYDDKGSVIAQAPAHVIENKKALNRFSANDKKRKKVVKKAPPTKNYTHYDEQTFNRLIEEPPEELKSQFQINHGLILNALKGLEQNGNEGYKKLVSLIAKSHESKKNKSKHRVKLKNLFKSLLDANIFSIVKNIKTGSRIVANESLQQDFSLHQSLSLYLIDALSVLDKESENYALDVLSLIEAIEENPRPILRRQLEKKKDEALAEMKAQGLEYDQRIEALEKIDIDKPNEEFIYNTYNIFIKNHPWVLNENIHPKSIVRAMYERGATFNEYISEYGLARAEGLLLRYISQTYKTLMQSVPDNFKTDELLDITAYIRTLLSRVDTSLIDEWESLFEEDKEQISLSEKVDENYPPYDPRVNKKAFLAKIRAELFHLVRLLAKENYQEAALSILNTEENNWSEEKLKEALSSFYDEYEYILADPRARNPSLTRLSKISDTLYEVTHTLLDNKEDNMWYIYGRIDLFKERSQNDPIIEVIEISS